MAVVAFAGAETGGTGELSTVSGIVADNTVVHGGGKYSFRVSAAGSGLILFAAHSTPLYFRGYFRFPAGLVANSTIMQFRSGASVNQAGLRLNLAGLTLRLTGSVAIDGTTALAPDVWHRIEMFAHQAGSAVEVRVNGRTEIVATGWSIPATIAQLAIQSSSGNTYWDDLHITEDNWPGPGYVYARQGKPGTPTYDTFTKTGGVLPDVWSETPSGIVAFAASTAASQTQTMKTESFSDAPRGAKYGIGKVEPRDIVYAAQVLVIAKRVGTTPDHYIARVIGGTLTLTAIATTTTDAQYSSGIFTATLNQLNTAEIGGSRGSQALATANLTIEDAWLMVSVVAGLRGLLHYSGCETGSLSEFGTQAGATLETGIKRTGGYAMKLTGAAALVNLMPTQLGTIEADALWVRAYIYLPALPVAGIPETILSIRDANDNSVSVTINSASLVRLLVNGVSAAVIRAPEATVNAWHRVELHRRISTAANGGYAALRFNGIERVSANIETGGAAVNVYAESRTNVGFIVYFDDLAISDADWLGAGQCIAKQGAVGAPAENSWALTGGATTQEVWSNTPINAASFAQAAAILTASTMKLAAHGLAPTECVIACRIVASTRLVSAGIGGVHVLRRRLLPVVPPGFIDTPLALASTVAELFWSEVFTVTPARLATMEIGGGQGDLPPFMRIVELWLMIEYAGLEIAPLPPPAIPRAVALVEIDL